MTYRTRLFANLPALLRGQQRSGTVAHSWDTAGLAPFLLRSHGPCRPCRRMLSDSPKQPAKPKRKGHPPDQLTQLADGTVGRGLAFSPDVFGRLVEASGDNGQINLAFEHHHTSKSPASFSNLWFRDACPCNQCVNESSGQKTFATCDVDAEPQAESCRVTENGDLEVVWANDFLTGNGNSHKSVYPLEFLQQTVLMRGGVHCHWRFTPGYKLWDRRRLADDIDARLISYEDWMAGGEAFAKAFLDLASWGLIFVRGVPESRDAVQDIASKIGDLQLTFYGLTWDVISKPRAENVAYTNEFLCLHQDLLYWRSTPKLQLLHCLKNECEGGDSLFSDGLRAAWELKASHEDAYKTLSHRNVNFNYTKNGNFYYDRRTVINENLGYPTKINWSPPFQAPFHQSTNPVDPRKVPELQEWRDAAKIFRDNLESPTNMLQYRLQPGDCVLFDNQRILHGRTQFDTSAGLRHLHGGYIDQQTLTSAFVRLGEQGALGALNERSLYRVGTGWKPYQPRGP